MGGGWISLAICVGAVYRLRGEDHSVAFTIAIIVADVNFLSFGIMHNFQDDPLEAPDFATSATMLSTATGLGLLIYSFF